MLHYVQYIMCNSHDALYQGYWDQLVAQWYILSCGHLDVVTGFPILTWTLLKRAEAHIKGGDRTSTTIQSGLYRCRCCATEVQASVELSLDVTC